VNNDAEDTFQGAKTAGGGGFLFLDPAQVPEEWQARATLSACVRLLPDEVAAIVGRADGIQGPDDAEFLSLVASGLSAESIARRVHSAPRSVYRRLARLRGHFGVETTTELVAELSRRGY
jgi:DNA-binding CsgD family transcriptional regulator